MTKTIELNGITPLKIKASAYDQERFCRIKNLSENVFFASCENENCNENADGVRRISAGESEIIDTKNYDVLYLNGTGKAEIVTSAYVNSLFRRVLKGGENANALNVFIDEKRKADHVDLNWIILENGSCKTDYEHRIDCYDVSSRSQIYIKIDDPECIFNWQNNYNVSSAYPNPNLIGSPVISGKSGFYSVPEGATWICFGVKNTDAVTGIYSFHVSGVPIVNA